MKLTGLIGFASISLGLTACASLMGSNDVKVRPLENMSMLTAISHDPLYESAVTAIDARDYARALEYLQEARTRDPRSVKTLNALGVVYDKLGRFDLSGRYYAQARAIDPESPIVAKNMDYSNSLQGLIGSGRVAADIPAAINPGTTAIKKPASLAAAYQPAVLPAVPRESEAAVPMLSSLSVGTQLERKSLTVPRNTVLATNERRHEYEPMATDATTQVAKAPPLAKSTPKEEPARPAVPEIRAVTNDPMPGLSQESKPLVANKVALVTNAPVVVKSVAKEAPASKPVEKIQTVAENIPAPVTSTWAIAKPEPKQAPSSDPAPQAKVIAAKAAEPATGILPANKAVSAGKPVEKIQTVAANVPAPVTNTRAIAKPEPKQAPPSDPAPQAKVIAAKAAVPATGILPVNKAMSASKLVPETKIEAASNMAPAARPTRKSKRVEAATPAPSTLPVIKPVLASAVLPVNKLPKAKIMAADEAVPIQRNIPVSRPEPVKVVASIKKNVLAIGPSNADTLRESKGAPGIRVTKPVKKVVTIGQPVRIFNSSGRAIEVIPRRLMALGWSVRQAEGRIQESTTLYYLPKDTIAAKAMQRTLPFPVRLIPNPGAGMRLVVGRDYLAWRPKNVRLAALWKGTVIASLQKWPARGDR